MATRVLREISRDTYRDWFNHHASELDHRSPFHQPAWLETASSGIGFELRCIGVFDSGEMSAAVPGFLARRGPFTLFGSPLRGTMTSYLGPLALPGSPIDEIDLIKACTRFARKRWRVGYVRFSLRDAPLDGPPRLGPGWRQETPRSYRLDLTGGVEGVWARMESDCRRNIRKARRLSISTTEMHDAALFYAMLDKTMRRHGTSSWHPERYFRRLMESLPPRNLLWSWGAQYNGDIVAAGLFLHDDKEVHFLSGASLPEYGSLPTSYLLHWQVIEGAASAGLQTFHSEASGVRSIDQFKESFRPAMERRHTLIWSPRLVRRAERLFMSASARWRRQKAARGG